MRRVLPRYNYKLDGEEFGNNTPEVIEKLGLPLDRNHKSFYRYVFRHSGLKHQQELHWRGWEVDLPQGKLVRIVRNEEEVERYRLYLIEQLKNN